MMLAGAKGLTCPGRNLAAVMFVRGSKLEVVLKREGAIVIGPRGEESSNTKEVEMYNHVHGCYGC